MAMGLNLMFGSLPPIFRMQAEKMVQRVMFAGNVHSVTSGIPMTLNTA